MTLPKQGLDFHLTIFATCKQVCNVQTFIIKPCVLADNSEEMGKQSQINPLVVWAI